MAFPGDWEYRREHQISSLTDIENFQVQINCYYGDGVTSGNSIYLHSKCRSDFGDIRFSDGTIEYSYWIEEKLDGISATFWVKIPDIKSTTSLYVYYGNPDELSASDGDATFDFFDDFNGTTLNTTKWNPTLIPYLSGTGTITINNSLKLTQTGGSNKGVSLCSHQPLSSRSRQIKYKLTHRYGGSGSNFRCVLNDNITGNPDSYGIYHIGSINTIYYLNNYDVGNLNVSDTFFLNTEQVYEFGLQVLNPKLSRGGSIILTGSGTPTDPSGDYIRLSVHSTNTTFTMSWIFVRNYLEQEPAHISWGAEEEVHQYRISSVFNPAYLGELVQFIITGGDTYLWNFGDGVTSDETTPIHIYAAPGDYSVTCLVNSYKLRTLNQSILEFIISGDPNPSFEGETVAFNATVWGSYHYWDFGDLTNSYDESPDHVYLSSGEYFVTYITCDATGTRFIRSNITLTIYPALNPEFTVKTKNGKSPFLVQFINLCVHSGFTYLWDFGDGNTSTDTHPIHEYQYPQAYTVSLITSGLGESQTKIKRNYIQVGETDIVTAGFTHDLTDNSAPVPVKVTFTDTSEGDITGGEWDFGDGAKSTDTNPIHTYAMPGYYFITRTVSNQDWVDERTELFYIRPRPAALSIHASVLSGPAPLTVIFTPVIVGSYIRLQWDFGDDEVSKEIRPTHTYTSPGTYTVTLTVWNTTTVHYIETTETIIAIDPALFPVPGFSSDIQSGLAPLEVTFTDLTTGEVDDLLWDFGDGNTSTEEGPVHEYLIPGSYTVSLTATNEYGEVTETKEDYITVESIPVAQMEVDTDIHYYTHEFSFTNTSLYTPSSWLWDFGDGQTSTSQNPVHTYASPQSYWVTLTVTNAHGSHAIGMDIVALSSDYPLPDFSWSTTNRKLPVTMKFTDTSQGTPTSWLWDFGDGNTSTSQNPVHTYQFKGEYVVSLTVTNEHGSATTTEEVLDV